MYRAKQSRLLMHQLKAHPAQLAHPSHQIQSRRESTLILTSRRRGTSRVPHGRCRILAHHKEGQICKGSTSQHPTVHMRAIGAEVWEAKAQDSSSNSSSSSSSNLLKATDRLINQRRVGWETQGERTSTIRLEFASTHHQATSAAGH